MRSDPYEAVRNLCASLEVEGHSVDVIADALLTTGLNIGSRLGGPDFVIAYLHKMIAVFEAQSGRTTQPSTRTQ